MHNGSTISSREKLCRGDIWNEKTFLFLSLAKTRKNAKAILKNYELFIYEDITYITYYITSVITFIKMC